MSTTATSPQTNISLDRQVILSSSGVRRGLRASVGIALGPLVWGISFGVVAIEAGFGSMGSVIMSLLVYSGSAQMVAADMVRRDAGMIAILVSTALISLRYIPMGISMRGWFKTTPPWLLWTGMHSLSDQSWAMTLREMASGRRDAGYFFGLNAGMVLLWIAGTAIGAVAGSKLVGTIDGLHFAATAALVGVLAEMEVRRADILPWVAAGAAAILAQELLGGSWYVFIGIVAGLAVVVFRGDDRA